MQEGQIVVWSDRHFKRDGEKMLARSKPVRLAIDELSAEVDFCQECDDDLVLPLRELLRALGSRTEQAENEADVTAVRALCQLCQTWMDVRSRSTHSRNKHPDMRPGAVEWRYGEDVEELWLCMCGVTFPTFRGRSAHVRRASPECGILDPDVTQEPKRPD